MMKLAYNTRNVIAAEHAVTLAYPFPSTAYPQLWAWMNEFPDSNMDDYSPRDYTAFVSMMRRRAEFECSWGVESDGELCGIINYYPTTPHSGMFHGICFTARVCGTPVTETAVRQVIEHLFDDGVEKISAMFFADNARVRKFLTRLGAEYEGYLREHTRRNGQPLDMMLLAILKKEYARCQ